MKVSALAAIAVLVMSHGSLDRKDVRLENNRFAPSIITARVGDTLSFVNGRGGPHNVQFADDSLSDAAHRLTHQWRNAGRVGGRSIARQK